MTELYRFQKQGVKKLHQLDGRGLLADEMGLGKTVQALMYASEAHLRPIVVVCEAGLKFHWEAEAARHCNIRAEILDGRKPPPQRLFRPRRMVIINYEILRYWLPFLKRLDPELVIIDEVQKIKSRDAQRTEAVCELCKGVPHIIGISGTPLTNRPAELFSILNILWPKEFDSPIVFYHRYCQPRLQFGKWTYKGATNLPELNQRLLDCGMIRRLKKDVLKDLPSTRLLVVPVPIENTKEYHNAETDFRGWLKKNFSKRQAAGAARAERLVRAGYLKRFAAKLKMPAVYEWLDNWLEETDEKLIVFGVHKSVLRGLHDRYQKQSVLVDGDVPGRQRKQIYEQFRYQAKTRFLFGNILAAGTGWNGSFCKSSVVVELPWTPGELSQALARMHRIGQKSKTTGWFLVAHGTIEEKICELLQAKQQVVSDTLDGTGNGEVLDIMDQLTRYLIAKGS